MTAARTCSRLPSRDKVTLPREIDFARARNFEGASRLFPRAQRQASEWVKVAIDR
jgi:hypothetical protein